MLAGIGGILPLPAIAACNEDGAPPAPPPAPLLFCSRSKSLSRSVRLLESMSRPSFGHAFWEPPGLSVGDTPFVNYP